MSEKEDRLLEQLAKMSEQIPVPDSLTPEKVNERLGKKRNHKRWLYGTASTLAAAAAVLCIILGTQGGIGGAGRLDTIGEIESYEQLFNIFRSQKVVENDYVMDSLESDRANSSAKAQEGVQSGGSSDHSTTNVQVAGVDEADVIKNDGTYIYMVPTDSEKSVDIYQGTDKILRLDVGEPELDTIQEMYVQENRLIVLGNSLHSSQEKTTVVCYDITDRERPKKMYSHSQSGNYRNSRLTRGYLYLFSEYTIFNGSELKRRDPSGYVPYIEDRLCEVDKIDTMAVEEASGYMVVSAFRVEGGEKLSDYHAYVTNSDVLYASEKYFYIATARGLNEGQQAKTDIIRFRYVDGRITKESTGTVAGTFNDQFSLDEKGGYLRTVVTTYHRGKSKNGLYVFDSNMKICGQIENLAPGERVYSARFMGNQGYFVTFRETDPLFSVDLSDPRNPQLLGKLKIPGFSEYLHFWGENMLLGIGREETETGERVKVSMFDISDPRNVKEIGKKLMPGEECWTEVSNTHKAAFVDYEKNLIGFPVEGADEGRFHLGYYALSWEKNQFKIKKKWEIGRDDEYYDAACRGLYMGDMFYMACTTGKVASTPLSELTRK